MFLNQTFSYYDIPLLLILIGLEILLSSDNVIAISAIAHSLPSSKRIKAIWLGFISAIFLRAAIVLCAVFIVHVIWIKILGALYLLFLSLKSFYFSPKLKKPKESVSFWKTILIVEATDFIFALDSVLAGVALVGIPTYYSGLYPKLWIVYLGGLIGAAVMRFAAGWVMKLIDIRPRLETAGSLIVGWVGIKLLFDTLVEAFAFRLVWVSYLFWPVLLLILAWGVASRKKVR